MFYKFLDTAAVDKVLGDGTLILSSLNFFREMENNNDPWIADRLEGATELTIPGPLTLTEGSSELDSVNRANIGLGQFNKFIMIKGGGRVEFAQQTSFVHQAPNMHIYCFSDGDLADLTKAMCVDARRPYDACLKIISPPDLLDSIMQQGECIRTKATAAALFKKARRGAVTYDVVSRDIRSGPVIAPSPFKKAAIFSPQREHRMLFEPMAADIPDTIIIKIPHPEKHFKEVFRDFKL